MPHQPFMFDRRFSVPDDTDEALKSFLRESNEPRDKALILVLIDINRSLQATAAELSDNTKLTAHINEQLGAHKEAFNEHLLEEQKLYAQGRGMYRGLTATVALIGVLFTAIFGMVAYIGNLHIQRVDSLIVSDATQVSRIVTIEQQLRALETQFRDLYQRVR